MLTPFHYYNLFHSVLQHSQNQQRQALGLPPVNHGPNNITGGGTPTDPSGNGKMQPTPTAAPAPPAADGGGGAQNIIHLLMGYQNDPNLQNLLKGYGTDPNVTNMLDQYKSDPTVAALMAQYGIGGGGANSTVPSPGMATDPTHQRDAVTGIPLAGPNSAVAAAAGMASPTGAGYGLQGIHPLIAGLFRGPQSPTHGASY